MIKAIETKYKGYRFRSRLEARWAVFFDSLNIRWEYEHQGFELEDGTRYLPDFWLPEFDDYDNGTFVEVKPNDSEIGKALRLAQQAKKNVLLAIGTPSASSYTLEHWNDDRREPGSAIVCFNRKYLPGGSNESEYRFYWYPAELEAEEDELVKSAEARAKGARFEYGENGT